MPYYLVPIVNGSGPPNAFGVQPKEPLGLEPASSALYLGNNDAVIWTTDPFNDNRAKFLGDNADELTAAATKLAMKAFRGDGKDIPDRLGDAIADFVVDPPSAKWNKLISCKEGYAEVRIGKHPNNVIWVVRVQPRPNASQRLRDSYDRADGNLAGTMSSDGRFTWSNFYTPGGADSFTTITSNQVKVVAQGTSTPTDSYYKASQAMDTPDHWVQVDAVSFAGGITSGHRQHIFIAVRANDAITSGYQFSLLNEDVGVGRRVQDFTSGATIVSDSVTPILPTTMYFAINGSSYLAMLDGNTIFSGTHTAYDGSGSSKIIIVQCHCHTTTAPADTVIYDNFQAADIVQQGDYSWANFKKPKLAYADYPDWSVA